MDTKAPDSPLSVAKTRASCPGTLRTWWLETLCLLLGLAGFGVVLTEGEHWVGALLGGIAISVVSLIVSYTCKSLFGIFVYGTYRRSVRSARVRGLRDVDAIVSRLMTERGYLEELTIHLPEGRRWQGLVFQNVFALSSMVFGSILLMVGAAALMGACSTLYADESIASGTTFLMVSTGCIGIGLGAFKAMSVIGKTHLGLVAIGAVHAAIQKREPTIATLSMNGPIHLPTGGHVVLGAQQNVLGLLNLSLSLRPLVFDLSLVDSTDLEQEAQDEDLGVEVFDRATILTMDHRLDEVIDGWLTPEVRSLLLALMRRGARVKEGTLWFELSLWRNAHELGRAVALIAALDAELDTLRAQTPKVRVFSALRRADDPGRRLILDRVGRLKVPSARHVIRRHWVETGEGHTRVYAASCLPPEETRSALLHLWQDPDPPVEVRGRALARLLVAIETHRLLPLELVDGLDAADHQALDSLLEGMDQLNAFPYDSVDDDWHTPCVIPETVSGLGGFILTALDYQLHQRRSTQVATMVSILDTKETQLLEQLSDLNMILKTEEHGLSTWSRFARALEMILEAMDASSESRSVVEQALKSARDMISLRAEQQVGGLAIASTNADGALSLTEMDA